MYIKVKAKPSGIPAAQVSAAPAVTDAGASQVTVFVSSLDAHSFPTVVAVMTLSTAEARDLAARIVDAANKADALAVSVDRAQSVSCPACKAGVGEPCHYTPYLPTRPLRFHPARVVLLKEEEKETP